MREALVSLCVELCPLDGPMALIRVDPAPGFIALVNDELLQTHRICIEVGRLKNINKNPVAEKAIQEVEDELIREDPSGGPISVTSLATALARLNSRIRERGISAREALFQRDMFTNTLLPIDDRELISHQHRNRVKQNLDSVTPKTARKIPIPASIVVGNLVYLHSDRNKTKSRDRYIVVSLDGIWCNIRKFTGSQLRSSSYKVKLSECFKVAQDSNLTGILPSRGDNTDDDTLGLEDLSSVSNSPLDSTPPHPPLLQILQMSPLNLVYPQTWHAINLFPKKLFCPLKIQIFSMKPSPCQTLSYLQTYVPNRM